MTRILAAVCAFLAIACLTLGLAWRSEVKGGVEIKHELAVATEALSRAQAQRKANEAILARRAVENAAAARESALLRQSLDRALANNQEWANEPLPQEVQDALY